MWERNTTLLLPIVVAFGLTECRTSDHAIQALNTLQKQVDQAIITGDTDRYIALLSDDAVLMPPNGPPGRREECDSLVESRNVKALSNPEVCAD